MSLLIRTSVRTDDREALDAPAPLLHPPPQRPPLSRLRRPDRSRRRLLPLRHLWLHPSRALSGNELHRTVTLKADTGPIVPMPACSGAGPSRIMRAIFAA